MYTNYHAIEEYNLTFADRIKMKIMLYEKKNTTPPIMLSEKKNTNIKR